MRRPPRNPAAKVMIAARGLALRLAAQHLLPRSVMFQRGPSTLRRVALTFDDGPNELTPRYLEVLAQAGARATFFLVGRECEANPGGVEAIVKAGHEVASHGFTHTRFTELGPRALRDELDRTAALLPPARQRPLVRPPHGTVTPKSLLRCVQAGYTSAMWSHDTLDWEADSADEVVRSVPAERLKPGDILLLHEGRPTTLEALPRVLDNLRAARFELVTVSELLGGSAG